MADFTDVVSLCVPATPTGECAQADFVALRAFVVRTRSGIVDENTRTDFANPQTLPDAENFDPPPLGTFQINDRGDFAIERGTAYLRKRLLRRATSALGAFFHLPNYGFAEPIKGTITPDLLRRMQARAQSQVLQEPDVVRASVLVFRDTSAPNVVTIRITVTDREGTEETVSMNASISP